MRDGLCGGGVATWRKARLVPLKRFLRSIPIQFRDIADSGCIFTSVRLCRNWYIARAEPGTKTRNKNTRFQQPLSYRIVKGFTR
jgi:hypothetical protein